MIQRRLAPWVCLFVWFVPETALRAQLPTAELLSLSRAAVQIGSQFELTLQGNRLDEISRLELNDLSGASLNVQATQRLSAAQPLRDWQDGTGTFDVQVPIDARPGLVEVRSCGRFGTSNSRTLLLTEQPVVQATTGHNQAATALAITSGQLIGDRTIAAGANYYRMMVQPGHVLRCAIYCKQLQSSADIKLRLLDGQGRLILVATSRGVWPAELKWHSAQAEPQEFFLEVSDLLGRGGPTFSYVLEARSDAATAKLADQQALTDQQLLPELYLNALLRPTLDRLAKSDTAGLASSFTQPLAAAFLTQTYGKFAESPAQPITHFPIHACGSLTSPQRINFVAQQGQVLCFDVSSAQLDQLTDPALVIYKVIPANDGQPAQLTQLAELDDAAYLGTAAVRLRRIDPQLVWTAAESGTYQVLLLDNQSGQRPHDALGYLLEVRPARPSFSLIAHRSFPSNNPATARPLGSLLMRSGTEQIHVTALRHDGFAGEIELQLEGVPAGLTAPSIILQPGATEADLVLQSTGDLVDVQASLGVVGTAQIGDQPLQVRAALAAVSAAASPTHNAVVSSRAGKLDFGVVVQDTAPLQVVLGDGGVIETKSNTKLALPIKLVRQASSAAECILRPQNLPPKVTLAEVKIAGDQSQASPELTIAGDVPPGEYTFWLQAETKVKWSANPQAMAREEEYLAKLKAATAAPDQAGGFTNEQLQAAIATATARIEQLKPQVAEAEHTLWIPSNPIRLRISAQ